MQIYCRFDNNVLLYVGWSGCLPLLLVWILAACQNGATDTVPSAGIGAEPGGAPVVKRKVVPTAIPDSEATDIPVALPAGDREKPLLDAVVWEIPLRFGTFSSPRLIDGPGGPEILIAFGNEDSVAGGAVAVDVATGEIRWSITSEHELFATPMPLAPTANGEQP